jgi:hypothetical protein
MRVVLYAEDMEPITVIELSTLAQNYLKERKFVRLAVMLSPMLSVMAAAQNSPYIDNNLKIVNIYAERLIRNGSEHMMLFTKNEESALLLKCAFLPGQQKGLQERERDAFTLGFMDALARIGAI